MIKSIFLTAIREEIGVTDSSSNTRARCSTIGVLQDHFEESHHMNHFKHSENLPALQHIVHQLLLNDQRER